MLRNSPFLFDKRVTLQNVAKFPEKKTVPQPIFNKIRLAALTKGDSGVGVLL